MLRDDVVSIDERSPRRHPDLASGAGQSLPATFEPGLSGVELIQRSTARSSTRESVEINPPSEERRNQIARRRRSLSNQ